MKSTSSPFNNDFIKGMLVMFCAMADVSPEGPEVAQMIEFMKTTNPRADESPADYVLRLWNMVRP